MTAAFPYDDAFEPPAPVLPLRIARPGDERAVVIRAIVDSGADCTLIPLRVARALRLPRIGDVAISGVAGTPRRAAVHAATIEVGGRRSLVRIIAFDDEAIIGRDLLGSIVAVLDGPRRILEIRTRGARKHGPSRTTELERKRPG